MQVCYIKISNKIFLIKKRKSPIRVLKSRGGVELAFTIYLCLLVLFTFTFMCCVIFIFIFVNILKMNYLT